VVLTNKAIFAIEGRKDIGPAVRTSDFHQGMPNQAVDPSLQTKKRVNIVLRNAN
jgi:hypothetical protein